MHDRSNKLVSLAAAVLTALSAFRASATDVVYRTNRVFQATTSIIVSVTAYNIINSANSNLTGIIIAGDPISTNDQSATEYEGVSWGQTNTAQAWYCVTNSTNSMPPSKATYPTIFDDPGWTKGVKTVTLNGDTTHGAYMWILENTLEFTTPGNTFYTNSGRRYLMDKVLLGTLGDYEPGTNYTEVFPQMDDPDATNWPGCTFLTSTQPSTSETVKYSFDTTTYYRLWDLWCHMVAHRPQTTGPGYGNPFRKRAVPDNLEVTPGVGIRVNGDDDNTNSVADSGDSSVGGENDLIEVILTVSEPSPPTNLVEYVLIRSNTNIVVWASSTKDTAILDSGTETNITFSATQRTVWVECVAAGSADLDLRVRRISDGLTISEDTLHFYPFTSIVVALGGEGQVPADPANTTHGVFQLAIDLYGQGYDVHMYDEDNVGDDGAGAVYDEVVDAVQDRTVTNVAVYGYSHGGGSTHDLSERLYDDRATIGAFSNRFTAYIDAIENDSDIDMQPEERRPPGSAYHVNYYQIGAFWGQWRDGDVDGGPIDPPGADYQVNVDSNGQTHTHFSIDDDTNVLNGIESRLVPRVPM